VRALIEARHPTARGEWVTFGGLRTLTGYGRPGRESYLDAFALNCWPSSGFTRVAYEVKVARSDWLRELRDPSKRRPGLTLSNEFWFAAPTGVIQRDEVPEACGFLEADAGGLKVRKAAPYRETEPPPLEFIASLLRAEQERDGRLDPRSLRAFRLAGRDLTVTELLEAADGAQDRFIEARVQAEVRKRVEAERAHSPEALLARAVRAAIGPRWTRAYGSQAPTVDEFRRWAAAQMGGSGKLRPDLAGAVKRAVDYTQRLLEDLQRLRAEQE
jgi:hypothetical protein